MWEIFEYGADVKKALNGKSRRGGVWKTQEGKTKQAYTILPMLREKCGKGKIAAPAETRQIEKSSPAYIKDIPSTCAHKCISGRPR